MTKRSYLDVMAEWVEEEQTRANLETKRGAALMLVVEAMLRAYRERRQLGVNGYSNKICVLFERAKQIHRAIGDEALSAVIEDLNKA